MTYEQLKQMLENQTKRHFDYLLTETPIEGLLLNGEIFQEYIILPNNQIWLLQNNITYVFDIIQQLGIQDSALYIINLVNKEENKDKEVKVIRE